MKLDFEKIAYSIGYYARKFVATLLKVGYNFLVIIFVGLWLCCSFVIRLFG